MSGLAWQASNEWNLSFPCPPCSMEKESSLQFTPVLEPKIACFKPGPGVLLTVPGSESSEKNK